MSKIGIAEALILAQKRRHDRNEIHRNQRRRTTAVSTVTDGFASLWSSGLTSVQEPNASDESGCEETVENDVGQDVEDVFDEESPWCRDAVLEDLMQSSGVSIASQSEALHNYTNVSVVDFCRSLVLFTRKSNLCKTHVKDLLDLINSALPQPNHLPTSVSSLLEKVSGTIHFCSSSPVWSPFPNLSTVRLQTMPLICVHFLSMPGSG
jgi:hypothetical protein